jgi:hypothetical protein|tara:strand:+ start:4651 stop:4920 length:270 start_codon:yes stop_codon:yes gene_type:complete
MSRYNTVRYVSFGKSSRIGTADIPKVEDKDSDILLIATHGDKCDMISQQYYGTPDFWWFIASVNSLTSNNIEAGTQLRIPVSTIEATLL